jgi:PAS domain S-box-containing protein
LTGWPVNDARGQPIESVFNIVDETSRRRTANPAFRALQEGTTVGLSNHTILISKRGSECFIDDSAAPIRDAANEVMGVVLVFRDVSGPRVAAEYRARLAAIVESSDDAIVGKDLTGRITSWNAGAEKLFGYRPDEIIGRSISILIPPERLDEETEILNQLRQGKRIDHFETVRITKDRRNVNVSLTISPIRDADGHIIGASKIARDITQRKATERELIRAREQLERHSEELEKTVAERTAELRHAFEQLETFSYSLSHDMRAPLRTITSFVQLVLQDHKQELRPEGRELLCQVVESSKRLFHLIDEVLASAKLKLSAENLVPVALDVVVPRVIAECPNLARSQRFIDIRQPLLPMIAAEALLSRCISNLLENAIKFVPPSRIPKVDIWTERTGRNVRLHIQDNGIGIPTEDQTRIFAMFTRGSNVDGVEGTGVGLAVVNRAIGHMGGSVGMNSKPDSGTDIWIDLPAASSAAPTVA